MEKLLIIMRGVPGSGKSSLSEKIKQKFGNDNVAIFSTDQYFLDKFGKYNFDPSKLKDAHAWNFGRSVDAFRKNFPVVVIDNTNIQKWQYQKYVDAAQSFGYSIKTLTADGNFKNVHGVPDHAIERMKKSFEPDDRFPPFSLEEMFFGLKK
jgi:tRNA uridine 5-carbamoylmethylation protein Kti12